MEGTLNAFYQDDDVVHACVKLMVEMVQNKFNRLRFDTWNINGLIVFKETAKYVIKLLQLWDCLLNKPCQQDEYKQKWKFAREICQYFMNIISGNYINFAICEYYNDDVFSQLCLVVVKMVATLNKDG